MPTVAVTVSSGPVRCCRHRECKIKAHSMIEKGGRAHSVTLLSVKLMWSIIDL